MPEFSRSRQSGVADMHKGRRVSFTLRSRSLTSAAGVSELRELNILGGALAPRHCSSSRSSKPPNFFQAFSKLFANFRAFSASFSKFSFGGFGTFQRLRWQKILRAAFLRFSKFFALPRAAKDRAWRRGNAGRTLVEDEEARFSASMSKSKSQCSTLFENQKDIFGFFCCAQACGAASRPNQISL